MKWNDKQTYIFVKLYLNHKCLWDQKDKFFKSRFKKREAYRSIVTKFHSRTNILVDEAFVLQKIKNLKSTYWQEVKKIRLRDGHMPTLSWFDIWHSCFQNRLETETNQGEQQGDTEDESLKKEWLEGHNGGQNTTGEADGSMNEEYTSLSLKEEKALEYAPPRRWNDRETSIFINLYLSNRCLWDPTDKYYKSKFKKREAYHNIIPQFEALTSLRIDESYARLKIRNLKTTYSQEVKKIRSRDGYKPRLAWFDQWHSCFQKCVLRQEDDPNELQDSEQETKVEWLDDSDNMEQSSEADRITGGPLHEDEYNLLSLEREPDIVVGVAESSYLKRKLPSAKKHLNRIESPKPESTTNEDEFDVYAKFIASQMRQLDKERALKLQMQIHCLVNEARMEALSEN